MGLGLIILHQSNSFEPDTNEDLADSTSKKKVPGKIKYFPGTQ